MQKVFAWCDKVDTVDFCSKPNLMLFLLFDLDPDRSDNTGLLWLCGINERRIHLSEPKTSVDHEVADGG